MRQLSKHRRVEVGGNHGAFGRHTRAQPRGDRTTAGANLDAPPPPSHSTPLELLDGPRIEQRLKHSQALTLDVAGVVERIELLVQRHLRTSAVWAASSEPADPIATSSSTLVVPDTSL